MELDGLYAALCLIAAVAWLFPDNTEEAKDRMKVGEDRIWH